MRRCGVFSVASSLRLLSVMGVIAFIGAGIADSQGIITGGITGSVTTKGSKPASGASVIARSIGTGSVYPTVSDSQGIFVIQGLPLGEYAVTITDKVLGQTDVKLVQVTAGNFTFLGKVQLPPDANGQSNDAASAPTAVITSDSAQSSTTIAGAQLEAAPVAGAMDNSTLAAPGVVATRSASFANANGANISVNGQRGRSNNFEIDGQTSNDTALGGPSFFFDNQDALQEIQVVTGDMGAQYGRSMGAVVNYITKQGTNSFHGTAFENYIGSWLSSLTQSQKPSQVVPRFVQNTWGGTVGGPILRDRLWFFGSSVWDRTFGSGVVETSGGAYFPDVSGLDALNSKFGSNPAVTALAVNGPFGNPAGNPSIVPGTQPTTVNVTDGSATAQIEVAQYQRRLPLRVTDQEHLGRIDYQLTPKDRLYLRYNYQRNLFNPDFDAVDSVAAAGGAYPDMHQFTHESAADWTHTFSASILNQIRYAFQQTKTGDFQGSIPVCTISVQNSCTSAVNMGTLLQGKTTLSLATYGYGPDSPHGWMVKVNQIQDNASWNLGRNGIHFGAEFDYLNSPWGWMPNGAGEFDFTPGDATYSSGPDIGQTISLQIPDPSYSNGLTSMLEGIAEVTMAQGSPNISLKEPDFAGYLQNDLKVRNNLTVNLGVRYEYFGQATNNLHDQSVARQNSSNAYWNKSLPLSATTVPKLNSDLRNIEPRVGFAYMPSLFSNLVIHGGFSINVDPELYEIFANVATSAPAMNTGQIGCGGNSPKCLPANGLTFASAQATVGPLMPLGGDPRQQKQYAVPINIRNPMAETYLFGLQYQAGSAAVVDIRYVGSHSFGLFQALNTNPDILDVKKDFSGYGGNTPVCYTMSATGYGRSNCDYAEVATYGNTAFSIYNALQTSLTLRSFHGFTGIASYTFSRSIDNATEFDGTSSGAQTSAFAQDPLNSDFGERGVSGISYPNALGVQLSYIEPWRDRGSRILNDAFGGYFLNALYVYSSGQPFNPLQDSPSVLSQEVTRDIEATGKLGPGVQTQINSDLAENSYCDARFGEAFATSCRPILSNPAAPVQTVGINLGLEYVDYVTGDPINPSAVHWLWNNKYEALSRNKPFPGVSRNCLRGDSFNNLDLNIGKRIHLSDRLDLSIGVTAFNLLNRAYYDIPDPLVEHRANIAATQSTGSFMTTSNTATQESEAGFGSFLQGLGNRNFQLSGKVTF